LGAVAQAQQDATTSRPRAFILRMLRHPRPQSVLAIPGCWRPVRRDCRAGGGRGLGSSAASTCISHS
jgi:hypothetical protein